MNVTWLVTGSAGFIGSNLCTMLLQNEHKVIGFDNLSTGKQSNIDRVMKNAQGRYNFVEGDICDKDKISKIISSEIDVVVHLAAQGSVQKSFSNVAFNNRQNIDGFLNVFNAAGENNIAKFIYASSCAVYGETDVLPITEELCPNPVSPYASSKLMNDLLSQNLSHLYPKTYTVGLRFFNIFGPWQDPFGDYAAVVPRWIDACIEGKQPIIFGDGSATRDFCYVGNVCELVENIGIGKIGNTSGVYNISSGVSISLNELYLEIIGALKEKYIKLNFGKADYQPWRDGDIKHSLGSIELARKKLDFAPSVDLRDGILNILSEQYGL
jgi:UDP-N-acetylglucosamine/UDP-N-acetylgalactosamine 4-epimerase